MKPFLLAIPWARVRQGRIATVRQRKGCQIGLHEHAHAKGQARRPLRRSRADAGTLNRRITAARRQEKRDVNYTIFVPCPETATAALKQVQHKCIFRQHLGEQFLDAGTSSKNHEMPHQCRAYTTALIAVDDKECQLGPLGLCHDEARSAGDDIAAPLLQRCNQSDMIAEVNIEKIGNFFFGEALLGRKQTPVERLRAALTQGRQELGSVVWFESSYRDGRVVSRHFAGFIFCWVQDTGLRVVLLGMTQFRSTASSSHLGVRAYQVQDIP